VLKVSVRGIGLWSPLFADWPAFQRGLSAGTWTRSENLAPAQLSPNARRRAPQSVKMAIEVMGQACAAAGLAPAGVSCVHASAMGDMDITDNLCRTLAADPRQLSPTRFHNSVLNAPVGYWSMAVGSHAPADAISAFDTSAAAVLMQAAVAVNARQAPVLAVLQEVAAPLPLVDICPVSAPIATAILLDLPGRSETGLELAVASGNVTPAAMPAGLQVFAGNPGAGWMPLLVALAAERKQTATLSLPLNPWLHLQLQLA
jgi:hypothetical protein